MEFVKKMIKTHPVGSHFDSDRLSECIIECFGCAQTCKACADACLSEEQVHDLVKCIRLNLDCADICLATGSVLSRIGNISDEILADQLKACMIACSVCANECNSHHQHEHCMICADSCNICKKICEKMLSEMTVSPNR